MIVIKVLIITPFYYPVVGGITSFVGNLRKGLSGKGISVSIITGEGQPGGNVEVIGSRGFSAILKIHKLIRKEKPDIIHSHGHWSYLIPCSFYKQFHKRTVLVHTFHTDPKKELEGIKKKGFSYLLSRYDNVTFVSHALMETYKKDMRINMKSAVVVYSGVSVAQPTNDEQMEFISSHSLDGKFPILCFMGPLTWKLKVEGVRRLIKAFEIIRKAHPSSVLMIVGDGEVRGELETLVKERKLNDSVVFTGFVDKPATPLSVADIYTHISLQEGLPLALLEAMALGKPVVASRTGGIPEVIENGKNGFLVDSEPEDIIQKILEMAGDRKLMENLGNSAQRTVKEKHNWEHVTEEFLKIYGKEIRN